MKNQTQISQESITQASKSLRVHSFSQNKTPAHQSESLRMNLDTKKPRQRQSVRLIRKRTINISDSILIFDDSIIFTDEDQSKQTTLFAYQSHPKSTKISKELAASKDTHEKQTQTLINQTKKTTKKGNKQDNLLVYQVLTRLQKHANPEYHEEVEIIEGKTKIFHEPKKKKQIKARKKCQKN